jgi:hypothetical protein
MKNAKVGCDRLKNLNSFHGQDGATNTTIWDQSITCIIIARYCMNFTWKNRGEGVKIFSTRITKPENQVYMKTF